MVSKFVSCRPKFLFKAKISRRGYFHFIYFTPFLTKLDLVVAYSLQNEIKSRFAGSFVKLRMTEGKTKDDRGLL